MTLSALNLLSPSGSYQYNESPDKVRTFDLGDSGTKLFTLSDNENIRVHALSPAYDVVAATPGSEGSFFGAWSTHARTRFMPDGTKALTLEDFGNAQRNTFDTAWDVTDINGFRGESDWDSATGDTGTATPRRGLAVGDGGNVYVTANPTGGYLLAYSAGTPFEPGSVTLVSEVDLAASPHSISGIDVHDMDFNSDGTSLVVVDVGNGMLHHFHLSTPWDIDTMTLNDSFDYTDEIPGGITVEWVQVSVADNDEHVYLGFIADAAGDDSTIQRYSYPGLTAVAASHTASIPLRAGAAHTAPIALRTGAGHTASIPLRVGAAHVALIRQRVAAAHTAPVALLQRLAQAHEALVPLQQYAPVAAAHEARIPLRVGAGHEARLPLRALVRQAHTAPVPLRTAVAQAHAAAVPLLDYNPVRAAHVAVFSLLGAPRTHMTMAVTLTLGGRAIDVIGWDIAADEGGYLYEGEVEVGLDGYGALAVNDAVTLDLFGEAHELVVESRRRDREGPAGRRYVIGLRSPTIRHDFPRAAPVSKTFDQAILARDAVEELLGEAVTWELVNWPISAFRLAWEETAPIAAARQIVEAAGGTIQTDPDGTLRVRHLYPQSPKDGYAGATAARVVDEQQHIVSAGESFAPRRLVDRLVIRDTVDGVFADRMEFEADPDNDRAGTVHVYPSPWRTNVVVTHTSNASLQLTALGETVREETEVVEFAAGRAALSFPIETLLSVEWLYVSLGVVSFDAYATELEAAQADGYSLARVKYETRSIDYRLISPTVDQAQLLLQEIA